MVRCKAGEPVECGTLLDGHNRHEICARLGIHYEIVEAHGIQSEVDALRWIDGNQDGRRNEPAFVRGDAVLEHKAEIQDRARANQQGGQGGVLLPENSPEAIETREVLADMADLSSNTIRKIERLREEAEPELLDALRRDEVSINLAHQVIDLPDEERTQAIEAMATVDRVAQVLRAPTSQQTAANHRRQDRPAWSDFSLGHRELTRSDTSRGHQPVCLRRRAITPAKQTPTPIIR